MLIAVKPPNSDSPRFSVDNIPRRLEDQRSKAYAQEELTHPGVEIVSRDRGDYYIKGATEGAPEAIQVTDRWHLLKNLREALIRAVDRHHPQVQAAAHAATSIVDQTKEPKAPDSTTDGEVRPLATKLTRTEQLRQQRRSRRLERYNSVMKLRGQGISIREIARQLRMNRSTVRRFVAADRFPERAERQYRRGTDPFEDFLRKRWQEDCHNAKQLDAELRDKGFQGSYDMVRRRVAHWRTHDQARSTPKARKSRSPLVRRLSSNQVAWLLLKPQQDLTSEEHVFMEQLHEHCPTVTEAAALAQQFSDMVKQRRGADLDNWLAKARRADGPIEMKRFGKGLENDLKAVRAALTLSWSNGQTEGQVNRLKLIKRQMFGRASFDLLRRRFLCPV